MADVFTRLSEQAAGTADAAQPSHAPFFAPLRDVDLPAPAAVLAGAPEAATAFAPWADDAVVAARTGWLDPLIPPDAIWADRPVPTLSWLASTLPPDAAAASPSDAPVAASPTLAAEGLEPSVEAGLRPPVALDATIIGEDAAVLTPMVTTSAMTLPPPSAPAGLAEFGPNRQAGSGAAHDARIEVNAGAQDVAAHAAANAPVTHDGSESSAAATAEGKRAVAADIHSPGAELAGEMPAPMLLAPAHPDLRDEAPGAAALPLLPAQQPAAVTNTVVTTGTNTAASTVTNTVPDAATNAGLRDERAGTVLPVVLPDAAAPAGLHGETPSAAPPVQTTRQLPSAAAEGRPPAENKVLDAHVGATLPLPHETSSLAEAAPARLELYAQPGLLRPEADFAQPIAELGTGSQQHRPRDPEGEPPLHPQDEMTSVSASVQPILPQRIVGTPDQEGSAGGILPAPAGQAADVLSQSATAAQQTGQPTAAMPPGEATGGPLPVPGISPTGGHVLPRTEPAPQTSQTSPEAQASTAIGTASKQALVAAVTGMAGSSPHDKSTRDVAAVQVAHTHAALSPAGRAPVQPAPTRSEGRGDGMAGDTSTAAGAPAADSTGVKQQPRVAAPPQPISHADAISPVEPVWTAAGHEVVQSTRVTGVELRHASSTEAAVRALTALPAAAPHAQENAKPAISTTHASAPVPPPIEAIRQAESARTAGSLQAAYSTWAPQKEPAHTVTEESPTPASSTRPTPAVPGQANAIPALEVVTASALSQPRSESLSPYPPAQPMADALASVGRPAVQPRLPQAAAAVAAAGRAGRHAEPQGLPTVHVTIGRIEVRFATPAVEQVPAAHQPSRRNLPLHAILQRDAWGAA